MAPGNKKARTAGKQERETRKVSTLLRVIRSYELGSWHRYERSKDATIGAPGLTTSNKKLLSWRLAEGNEDCPQQFEGEWSVLTHSRSELLPRFCAPKLVRSFQGLGEAQVQHPGFKPRNWCLGRAGVSGSHQRRHLPGGLLLVKSLSGCAFYPVILRNTM